MGALDLDLTPKTRLWEWRWRYAAVSLAARGPPEGRNRATCGSDLARGGRRRLAAVLDVFTSCVAGNGSAVAGLTPNTPGFNLALAAGMPAATPAAIAERLS
jgi:Potassium-transporting ATPase A subunit